MPNLLLPSAAVRAALPVSLRPKIVSSASEPPSGPDWLHEVKHDGHRLIAMIAGRGSIKLLSRNGKDRTHLFRTPFRNLAIKDHALVLDGEIAVPDERGITHIDALNDALVGKQPERLTYFAFDLIYADGHDIRRCPIEHRKAALKELLDNMGCERIVYVDHIVGNGDRLFERVATVGAEGIVSKRLGRSYGGGDTRDWLKTKCHQISRFMITGFQELGEGRLEALHVAEEIGEALVPAGQVRFGFAGKGLWGVLDQLRSGKPAKGIIPVRPLLMAEIKFFGRHKGGSIRDGMMLDLIDSRATLRMPSKTTRRLWDCDSDAVVAAMSMGRSGLRTKISNQKEGAGVVRVDSKMEFTIMSGHGHPGEREPRAHGETHHENRIVDLNTAPEHELADLPMVGAERAKALIAHRPFRSWDDVQRVPGFSKSMVDDLKSGGAQIGS